METLQAILDALGTAMTFAPWLAAVGGFSLAGQISKQIFTKEKALKKGKYQAFWWRMRQTLPLHPVAAGVILGLLDKAHGVAYYAFAGVVSVFLFDLIERFTGFDIDLPGDSLPPEE